MQQCNNQAPIVRKERDLLKGYELRTNYVFYLFYFIYSFCNVDNYGKITVYNKNSSKMLVDVNILVKNKENKTIEHKTFYRKR